jgi:hypothetical protein
VDRKIYCPAGILTPVVRLAVRYYTDWDTSAPRQTNESIYLFCSSGAEVEATKIKQNYIDDRKLRKRKIPFDSNL